MNLKIILTLLSLLLLNSVKAQTSCSGGIPLSNNIRMAILEKGTTQIGSVILDETSGIGDAPLLARYNFVDVIGKKSDLSFGIRAKISLGSATEKSDKGIVLNADLQPGSGTWDIVY